MEVFVCFTNEWMLKDFIAKHSRSRSLSLHLSSMDYTTIISVSFSVSLCVYMNKTKWPPYLLPRPRTHLFSSSKNLKNYWIQTLSALFLSNKQINRQKPSTPFSPSISQKLTLHENLILFWSRQSIVFIWLRLLRDHIPILFFLVIRRS